MNAEIRPTKIDGVFEILRKPFVDERGAFHVLWERGASLAELGAYNHFNPSSAHLSKNLRKGTLRGLHFQAAPYGQNKLVACASGRAWDVVVDLRVGSPTHRAWDATEIDAERGNSLFIPAGCAHGFLTLEPDTAISYLIDGEYRPDAQRALRWNDPVLGIEWPIDDPILSEKDATALFFAESCES